jgi:signal transduction histidine kinase
MGGSVTIPVVAVVLVAAAAVAVAAGLAVYLRVSRRKAAELEEKIRKAESLSFVGTLAGGLAHEIRNPLSTLNINLQLLKEDWADPVTSKEQRSVKRIDALLRETNRLERVLSDFLRFAGRYQLHREPHRVNAILEELLDFYGPEARQRKIAVKAELDPSVPVLPLDAALLRQAFVNVVKNAQEAMPAGGTLAVRTAAGRRAVDVEIADTGIGIAPEHREQIFEVYFTTKPNGSGLGLPTTRRIVEEHGGTIAVESEPGKGTRVRIQLPLA